MKCPYCDREMKQGILYGDGRSRVRFNEGHGKVPFFDSLTGTGSVTAVKYSMTTFKIEAGYCDFCKKMVIDTDVER